MYSLWLAAALCSAFADDTIYPINTPAFELPIQINAAKIDAIDHILLHVSRDQGKTWKQIAKASPLEERFRIKSDNDGEHWYAIQVVLKNGEVEPQKLDREVRCIKVLVQARRPRAP
ncbi:MAG: hypothetical protein AB7K24_05680 [Gemmataceae bacterium]